MCGEIVAQRGRSICKDCAPMLKPIKGVRCYRCSRPLLEERQEFCYDCSRKKHVYQQGIAVFGYQSPVAQSLYQLKYHARKEYGIFYGHYAAVYAKKQIQAWKIEVLIPVPLHPSRLAKRGYNQAEVIARAMGEKLNLPVVTDAVKRVEKTKPLKELNPQERRKSLQRAFMPAKNQAHWKNVLIIDDIYTTGSTIDAVSRVLFLKILRKGRKMPLCKDREAKIIFNIDLSSAGVFSLCLAAPAVFGKYMKALRPQTLQ